MNEAWGDRVTLQYSQQFSCKMSRYSNLSFSPRIKMTTAAVWACQQQFFFNPTLLRKKKSTTRKAKFLLKEWLSKIKSFSGRLACPSWDKFYTQLPSHTELVEVRVSYPPDHYWRPCRSQLSVMTNAHVSALQD